MTSSIDTMLASLLKLEGGFVNNVADRGGPTKYGITQGTLSDYLGHKATIDDVKNLDINTACVIYKNTYYYAPQIDTLPDDLQPQLFDISVNSGPRKSISILQTTLNQAGFQCATDGELGPRTRNQCVVAFKQLGDKLINAIESTREQFYKDIVYKDVSQEVFLNGWLNRARTFIVKENT